MPASPPHALDFLSAKRRGDAPAVCVAFGDDAFLHRLVHKELRHVVLGDEDGEFSLAVVAGDKAVWRDVKDELSTVALFGSSRRLVIVEDADDFVKDNRPALEDYVARPARTGTLVLDVKTWPKTTRLYKALSESGWQIDCSAPTPAKLLKWVSSWAKDRHGAELPSAAAELLIEIVGPELGLLDQEIAKLAAYAGAAPIAPQMVHDLVGGWRTKTTWEMIDAATEGDAAAALAQADRLLGAGEHPLALLGPIGYVLRQYAAAARRIEQAQAAGGKITVAQALEQAGVKPFAINKAEPRLRQLGRQRAGQLYRWLLDADLDLKGASNLAPRVVLERLIVRMAKQGKGAV